MEEPQKLFRFPGTIDEEEQEEREAKSKNPLQLPENIVRPESPLLGQRGIATSSSLPRNITLIRVNTQSSSIGGIGRQDSTRSRYRAGPTRKLRRRAVLKNGDCNVLQSRISRRSLRFLQDIFTTLVDTQWRWTLMCFILSFFLSWLGFAVIWWLIAFTHGDFEEGHLPPFQVENDWTPCVYNIFSFTSCFLFSIETQHTIGYGSRSTTEECPEAIFVMCIQSISGVMIQAFMVGIVFAKMTRPKQRTQTLLFSRNAVICQRDDELCLMFRVGDLRKSHIIGATVRAQIIRTRTTKEGEILPQNQQELVVGTDGQNGDLFFIWPTTIIHKINAESPFYNISAEDMLTERFEVVLILEGTIESTGQTTQARSSYLPQEILWGYRFDPMVTYSKDQQGFEVDHSLFNSTTQVDTPLCSGRELAEFYRMQDDLRHTTGVLIDEDLLMEKQCRCACRSTTQQRLHLPLTRLETVKSDNVKDNQCWQNVYNVSNYTSNRESRIEKKKQLKVFDFDSDAIQVIEDMECRQLPEAVNKEMLKNNQNILFERGRSDFFEEENEEIDDSIEGNPIRLDRSGKGQILKDTHVSYEDEKFPLLKIEDERKAIRHHRSLKDPQKSCQMRSKDIARKSSKLRFEERSGAQKPKCHFIITARGEKYLMKDAFVNGSGLIKDSLMSNDRSCLRKDSFNKNVKVLKEGKKSLKVSGKYLLVTLDHSCDNTFDWKNLVSCQGLNISTGQNSNRQIEQHNMRIENERSLKRSSHIARVGVQRKFHPTDIRSSISPISYLSPESGFYEGNSSNSSPQSSCACSERNLSSPVRRMPQSQSILIRENSSSSESDVPRENFVSCFDNSKQCTNVPIVETSIRISDSFQNVNKMLTRRSSRSSYRNLTCKQSTSDDDDNLVDGTDAATVKEQIVCMDDDQRDIDEMKKKHEYSNSDTSFREFIDDDDSSKEPVAEEQLCRNNRIENIDKVLVRRNSSSSSDNSSCKYFVNDVIHLEEYDDAFTAEEQVIYSEGKLKNTPFMRRNSDFLDSNRSCENLINNVVDQRDCTEISITKKRAIHTSV